jgi:hypothetical protein
MLYADRVKTLAKGDQGKQGKRLVVDSPMERWGCKALVMAGGNVCLPRSKAPAHAFDAGARVKAALRRVEGDKIVTDQGHGFKQAARDVQRGRSGEVDERAAALADAGSNGQNRRCA